MFKGGYDFLRYFWIEFVIEVFRAKLIDPGPTLDGEKCKKLEMSGMWAAKDCYLFRGYMLLLR